MSVDPKIRALGIGGTDIAALVGVSPSRTAFDVYREKTGLEGAIERTVNQRMWAGKRLEKVIAEMYSERTERAHSWFDKTISGRRVPQVFTPDAFVEDSGGLDCKNVAWDQASKWGEDGSADVPDHVAIQCQWYLDCSGRGFWDVAAFFGGNELRVFRILPDPEMRESLHAIAERFWRDHVLAKVPPQIEYSEATADWIRRRFPRGNGNLREATKEEWKAVIAYREAHEIEAQAESEKKTLALRLKEIIGEYDGLTNAQGVPLVTNRKARDGSETDWESIAIPLLTQLPEDQSITLLGLHTNVKPGSRRLLLKGDSNGSS